MIFRLVSSSLVIVICHCCLTSSVISHHLLSHVICHCHLTSSAIVVSRHLPLSSHICICHLTSSAIVVSRHLSLSSHIICNCCLTSSAIIISRHLPLSSHVICHWHLTVVNFTTSLTTFEVIYLSSTTFSIIVCRCAFACLFSLKLIFFFF